MPSQTNSSKPPLGAKPAGPVITLTRFTNEGGRSLTKKISLAADDSLVSDKSAMVMSRGIAERITVDGVAGLGALIETLATSQALALGGLRADLPNKVNVTTEKLLQGGKARVDLIARTNANIVYEGPAFALLDYDTKGMPPAVAAELARHGGFWPALVTVLPALGRLARVSRSSTSSGLSRTDAGAAIPGSDGVHVFITIKDGADAVRFLKALHERCWLAGFGWMMVGAAGQLLNRSIVDRMVGQSGRLVFEGGPELVPPLVQDKSKRRPVAVDGAVLDTAMACLPLTITEQARYDQLKAAERQRLKPEEVKERKRFIKAKAEELSARTGMTASAAKATVLRWSEGILRPDVELPFDDEALAGCTVADVLADPERFADETLADPLEGVDYGRCVAKIMIRADGTPWIHSFAHGRTIYELKYDAAHVRKVMEAADKKVVVATFATLAAGADIDPIELEELRQLAKTLSGSGLRVINAMLKAGQQQQAISTAETARNFRASQRQDPRLRIRVPAPDDPWMPQMDVLNEVISVVVSLVPPSRDIDDDAMQLRKIAIPGTHAFTDANAEGDDE